MATTLYLRDTTATGIGGFRDALTTRGSSTTTTGVVNTAASGTNIQWTATAGGSVLEWISGRSPSGGWTLAGTITVRIRAVESNMNANAGGRLRLYKRSKAGVETEITGSPWDDGAEFSFSSDSAMDWTGTPTSTAFAENDRLVIRLFITNVGTMGGGNTCTLSYDGPTDGAAGDTFVQLTETVAFKAEPTVTARAGFNNNTANYLARSGNPSTATSGVTLAAWVWRNGTSGDHTVVLNGDNSGYSIEIVSNKFLGRVSGVGTITDSSTVNLYAWYHVALVESGGTWKLYVNGQSVGTPISGTANTPTSQFSVGVGFFSGSPTTPMQGRISDVALWNTALSQANLQDIYDNRKGANHYNTSLVAHYKLDEASGAAVDAKGGTSLTEHGTVGAEAGPDLTYASTPTISGSSIASTLATYAGALTLVIAGAAIGSGSQLFAGRAANVQPVSGAAISSTLQMYAGTAAYKIAGAFLNRGPTLNGGTVAQTVVGASIASTTQVFPGGIVTTQSVTGAAIGAGSSLFAGSVGQTVAGASISSGTQVFAGSAAHVLTGASIASTKQLYAGSLSAGVTGASIASTTQVYAGSVGQTLVGASLSGHTQVFAGAVSPALTGATIASTKQLYAGVARPAVGGATISSGTTLYGGSTSYTLVGAAISSTKQLYTGSLLPVSFVTGASVGSTSQLYAGTLVQRLSGAFLNPGASVNPGAVAPVVVGATITSAKQLYAGSLDVEAVVVGAHIGSSSALLSGRVSYTVVGAAIGPTVVFFGGSTLELSPIQPIRIAVRDADRRIRVTEVDRRMRVFRGDV